MKSDINFFENKIIKNGIYNLIFIIVVLVLNALMIFKTYNHGGIGYNGNLFEPTAEDGISLIDLDTGMDFFNSIQYTKGADPYIQYEVIYPPLANLFFYGLFEMFPRSLQDLVPGSFDEILAARGTYADVRVHQAALFVFIIYISLTMILLFMMIQRIVKNVWLSGLTAFTLCFVKPVVYALERGNIILSAILLTLFFLEFYRDDRALYRELAYIALALAAGIKLYPALFGVLLLVDKRFMDALRTMIYGVAALFLPFAFFGGYSGLKVFFSNLTGYEEGVLDYFAGYGVANVTKLVTYLVECIKKGIPFGTTITLSEYSGVISAAGIAAYVLAAFLLICCFFVKEDWKKYLFIGMAIVSMQESSFYTLLFLLPGLVFMLAKEKDIDRGSIWEFVLMTLIMIPVPYVGIRIAYMWRAPYTLVTLFYQIVYTILLIRLCYVGIRAIVVRMNKGEA